MPIKKITSCLKPFLIVLVSIFSVINTPQLYAKEHVPYEKIKLTNTAAALTDQLSRLIGAQDAVIAVSPNNNILIAIHADKPLIPASILKILTAAAAFHYLGETYRFHTNFHLSPHGDLKIKGFGDPLLVSEQVTRIAGSLAKEIKKVNNIILDDSYFAQPIVIPGRHNSMEPYDAPNGALNVNFNTVFFKHVNGQWVSAEPQTPLLPSIIPKIQASGLKTGRITFASESGEALHYSGEIFGYFLKKAGVKIEGRILLGRVDPDHDRLVYSYRSEYNLRRIIAGLLEFSNNFTANQMLLTIGANQYGAPATMAKGIHALKQYCVSELGIKDIYFVEGSGISRQNRISCRSMLRIMEVFEPYRVLMRHQGRQWFKTGTLKGIKTRAGYLASRNGEYFRFVIMVNTPGKTTRPIIKTLEQYLP